VAPESFRVSTPGKLMLLGEHAVLSGSRCLVCAVNQRLNMTFKVRTDRRITITSSLGYYETDIDISEMPSDFRFILTALKTFKEQLNHGLDLKVESEFTPTVGLGSSAAVTAAVVGGLLQLVRDRWTLTDVFQVGLNVIRAVQGSGSGADLAAGIFGGILLYRSLPHEITPLPHIHPITVIYSGAKTPTTEVIKRVGTHSEKFPDLFHHIYSTMDKSVELAAAAIGQQDWIQFGELLNLNQGLMDAIGVSNRRLAEIIFDLRAHEGILGAKISGSGLGDCVVGLGETGQLGYEKLPLQMSKEGLRVD